MAVSPDYEYLMTLTGQLNIAEIVCLLGSLISVAFTSNLYCELVDNLQYVYPDLNTVLVRSLFQSFAIFCFTITIVILVLHLCGLRFLGERYIYINQLCIAFNVVMGLLMFSIGVCAAFWEGKLRRTPAIIRRGYFSNSYQYLYGELTHPRPGAAAAAAVFAILSGILLLIEACTRPMLGISTSRSTTYYTRPMATGRDSINDVKSERIVPIETTTSSQSFARV